KCVDFGLRKIIAVDKKRTCATAFLILSGLARTAASVGTEVFPDTDKRPWTFNNLTDTCNERFGRKGLGYKLGDAAVARHDNVRHPGLRGQHNDGRKAHIGFLFTDPAHKIDPA